MAKVSLEIEQIDALRNGFSVYNAQEVLSVGDIVVIREGMEGTFRFPTVDRPGIIVEIIKDAKRGVELDGDHMGSPLGPIVFDIIVLSYDQDDEVCLNFSSSRFLSKVGG